MQLIAVPRQLHQLVAQIMVIVRRAVDGFRDALAVGIVAVGDIRPGLAHPRELAAVLPCVGLRAVAQKVADLIRRQALAADVREQIAPARVAVTIGFPLQISFRLTFFYLFLSHSSYIKPDTNTDLNHQRNI